MLCCLSEPSVTIQSWSVGHSIWMVFADTRYLWALGKAFYKCSDHFTTSCESFLAVASSKELRNWEQLGMTQLRTLYDPINFSPFTVYGGWQELRVEILCGLAVREPLDHIQPKIDVFLGHIVVLPVDSCRLALDRVVRTLRQIISFPPM